MIKKLFVFSLLCISMPVLANTNSLPFVGTKNFYIEWFDGQGGNKQIKIEKSGTTTIFSKRQDQSDPNKINQYILYKGKYKTVIPINDNDDIHYIKIINANKIAYTNKQGKILKECDDKPCVADLK